MPVKFHVKKGDEVVVIAGASKGRRGKISEVLTAKQAVVLEGSDDRSRDNNRAEKDRLVKPVLHHLRKSQQSPQGGLLWLEGPVHVSNVMKVADYEARRTTTASSR
ncbi:MAG TPA: 50S ribosomal protein L24 [Candidatus Limnocylindria bacterium]|jgi:large subunit ribosomal protein L24|nr:50S ribosomal protein L24 [Candidatus Limnocylindria bacterium]